MSVRIASLWIGVLVTVSWAVNPTAGYTVTFEFGCDNDGVVDVWSYAGGNPLSGSQTSYGGFSDIELYDYQYYWTRASVSGLLYAPYREVDHKISWDTGELFEASYGSSVSSSYWVAGPYYQSGSGWRKAYFSYAHSGSSYWSQFRVELEADNTGSTWVKCEHWFNDDGGLNPYASNTNSFAVD